MLDFLKFFSGIAVIVLALVALVVGCAIANANWNCNSWANATGDKTRVVAGECMVYDAKTHRWELYGSYVRHHNLDVSVEND